MKESGKWRSGREGLRTSWTGFSSRGGKSGGAFGNDESKTRKGNGHVMVPTAKASPFEVVETQLALEVLVCTLGSPALLDDSHGLLARKTAV